MAVELYGSGDSHLPHCCCCFSCLEALKYFRNQLTVYEQKEILNYAELWFLGLEAKKVEGLPETQNNNCYDDEHGSYLKVRKFWYLESG